MRVFLLTLAVVDDLIAICIIAIFYTNNFHGEYLLFALIPLALFAFIAYRGETMLHLKPLAAWLLLLPLGNVGQLADIGGLRPTPTMGGATRQRDSCEQQGRGGRTCATGHERGHIFLLLSD